MAFALPLALGLVGQQIGGWVATGLFGYTAAGLGGAIGFLGGTLAGSAIIGKNTGSKQRALASTFQIPVVTEGIPIPIVYGTQRLSGFVATYSNFKSKTVEHHEDVGGTGLGGTTVTSSEIRYYLDYQYVFCFGPVKSIKNIDVNKKDIFTGPLGNGSSSDPVSLTTDLGQIEWYWGFDDQPLSSDLVDILLSVGTSTPRSRRICYFVAKKFHLNNSPNLPPITATVSRFPPAPSTDGDWFLLHEQQIGTGDANPAMMILDLLTDKYYGLRIPQDYINLDSFKDAAYQFSNEKFGLSMTIDRSQPLASILEDIKVWTNSFLSIDPNGKIYMQVNRENTPITSNDVVFIDDNAILPGTLNVQSGSWSDVTNVLKIEFTDATVDYTTRSVQLYNSGNLQATGIKKVDTVNLAGITDKQQAVKQGNRLLYQRGFPLAKASFEINRTTARLHTGRRIWLRPSTWRAEDYLVMHVTQIEESEPSSDRIKVSAVEDSLYHVASVDFGSPDDVFIEALRELQPLRFVRAYQLPVGSLNPSGETRILIPAGQYPNEVSGGFWVYGRLTGSEDDYELLGQRTRYVPAGQLLSDIPGDGADVDATFTFDIQLDGINDSQVSIVSSSSWSHNKQVMLVGNEIISVKKVEPFSEAMWDNTYHVTGVRRGVLGSIKEAHYGAIVDPYGEYCSHTDGEEVFFIRQIEKDYFTSSSIEPGNTYDVKVTPFDSSRIVPLDEVPEFTIDVV